MEPTSFANSPIFPGSTKNAPNDPLGKLCMPSLLYEDLTWDSARGKDDEALADELAREWDLERLQAENFSPFSGTYLGDVECKEGLNGN
jgi:hypothetical protein